MRRGWPWAPAPYDQRASGWNTPVELRDAPWGAVRSHSPPQLINPSERLAGTMWLPWKSTQSFGHGVSAHPAMLAVSNSERRLSDMAQAALQKHAAGLALTTREAQALMTVRLPPVVRRQIRTGVGRQAISNRVAPQQRAGMLPPEVEAKAAEWREPFLRSQTLDAGTVRSARLVDRARRAMLVPVIVDLWRRR